MDPAEKIALKEKLAEKGIGFDKAAEELKVPASLLALYLKDDSNPVPSPKELLMGSTKCLNDDLRSYINFPASQKSSIPATTVPPNDLVFRAKIKVGTATINWGRKRSK